jgi:hypothetical protein
LKEGNGEAIKREVLHLSFMRIKTLPVAADSLAFLSTTLLAFSFKYPNLVSISDLGTSKST